MKTFYDSDERYNEIAQSLDREVLKVLEPIFKRWVKYGYKARDISKIMSDSVYDIELRTIIGW